MAGLEPEHTNELLQILGKCVIARKESSRAVQRVLKGEKPNAASNANLSITDDLLNESNQKKKSDPPRSPAKSPVKTQIRSPTKSPIKSQQNLKSTKTSQVTKPSTNRSTNATTNQTTSKTASKTTSKITSKPTTNLAVKKTVNSNSTAKPIAQRAKVPTTNKPSIAPKTTGQPKIGKPVTRPSISNNKSAKQTSQTNQNNANSISKNRTLTKEELNAIQKIKANAEKEQDKEVKNVENEENIINESNSLEMTNQKAISKSITDDHIEMEKENVENFEKEDAGKEY